MSETSLLRSPGQMAATRFWRISAARWGSGLLAVMMLLAIYQPFLCHDLALVWLDSQGLRFPLLSEFFNRNTFPERHDLLFNLADLLVPLAFVSWFFLRKNLGTFKIVKATLACLFVLWVFCQIPMIPAEGGRRALWTGKPNSSCKIMTYYRLKNQTKNDAGIQLGDLRVDTEGTLWSLSSKVTQGSAYFLALGGGRGKEWNLSELQLPQVPWGIFPPCPHPANTSYEGQLHAPPMHTNAHTGAPYLLGADSTGRDVFSRMLSGTRISLTVGLVATGLSLGIGIFLGAISGYFGGWVDLILQRMVEIMMTFPTFLLILIIVAMLDRNIFLIMTVIGLTGWANATRLVRGEFLQQSAMEYVLAARALGLPKRRIMFMHILPNTMTPIIISASFGIAGSVLTESTLAFIGLGDTSVASWGGMLAEARSTPGIAWLIYTPGIAIFLLVFSLNLIGNALREALDPKHAA